MKTILLFIFLFSALLQVAKAQADIRLYPSRLFFYPQEGMVQQKTIHLVNKSTKKVVCRAEMLDWKRDSTGNKIYYVAGTLPTSASAIMSVKHDIIILEPGEDKEVIVSMNMKKSAGGFKNAMLFFTQIDTDSLKNGLKILIQLGAHLYSLPEKNVEKQIMVTNAAWQDKNGKANVRLSISNTTKAIIDSEIKAEILDESGDRVETSIKVPFSSMPGDIFSVNIPFTKTSKFKNGSKIIVYLDNGFEHPLQVIEIPYKF